MHTSELRSARKFQMKERRLNSWSKLWLVACHLCTDGHIASWAMQRTQRARFKKLFSLRITTLTSSEGRRRSLLGLPPSCLTALDCSYADGQDTSMYLSTSLPENGNHFQCRSESQIIGLIPRMNTESLS